MNLPKKRFVFLLLAAILFNSTFAFAQIAKTDCIVRVTFLHVNDVYQFVAADGGKRGGLARIATLKKQALLENQNTLFVMAGDTISPSVESITYKGKQMIDAWNALGIDYAAFGNHEFDFGTEILKQRIAESRFQWLNANVTDTATGKLLADLPPYAIRDFGGVKVGVIGLVLTQTKITSKPGKDVNFAEPCEAAKKYVPEMRAKGANVVVGLTHQFLYQDKDLANCADFDLILGGHEHTLLQSSANGTPIFKMTADAREMGKYNLSINRTTGKLESIDWEVVSVTPEIAEDADFNRNVTEKYRELLEKLSKPVGQTAVQLDARSDANRQRETNIADFIADAFRAETKSDVALINGGAIRADLLFNAGILTERSILSTLPFGTPIVKIEITGAILRAALEHGVARSAEDNEPGRFPQVSGIRFAFDATLPAGSRVTGISVNGKPLDEKKTYTMASPNFIVEGGDGYDILKSAKILISAKQAKPDSEILRAAIVNSKTPIAPQIDGRIRRIDNKKGESNQNCPTTNK